MICQKNEASKMMENMNEIEQFNEYERQKNEIKHLYCEYIMGNINLYLDILVMYIRRITLNESHTLEDIEIFSKTINLFRFAEDNSDDDNLTKPLKPRIVFMNIFDGFVGLE